MKKILLPTLLLVALLMLISMEGAAHWSFLLLLVGGLWMNWQNENRKSPNPDTAESLRTSVTFLLGSDKPNLSPYYRHAASYFRQFDNDGTHEIIIHLRSMDQVLEYLKTACPGNCPWKTINVVVHELDRQGLQTRIGQPSSHPFPTNVIDKNTQLNIFSPGINNESALVKMVSSMLMNTQQELPQVSGSSYFNDTSIQTAFDNEITDSFYISFPADYIPSHQEIADAFHSKYPHLSFPWDNLLTPDMNKNDNRIYTYQFLAPESWSFLFHLDNGNPHFKWQVDIRKRIGQQVRENTWLKRMNVTTANDWWNITPVKSAGLNAQTPATKSMQSGTRIFCVQVPILEIAA